ncbi:MAG: hypothetical protein H0V86_05520, partial [Chloroflexia bacterium]|nr:hypothetical protein [Chloroflexia bacterium]
AQTPSAGGRICPSATPRGQQVGRQVL